MYSGITRNFYMKVIQEHKSATYHDAFQGSLKYFYYGDSSNSRHL